MNNNADIDIQNVVDKIKRESKEIQRNDENLIDMPRIYVKERLNRYICAVDDFGNVEYYTRLPSVAKKDKIKGGDWMASFQESLMWISEQDLSKHDLKVFIAMCGMMDFDNYITFNQSAMAKKIHTDQADISRAIKKLLALNIIAEGPRAGLNKTYILNPNIGIKGKQKQQKIIDYQEAKDARAWEKANETKKRRQAKDGDT